LPSVPDKPEWNLNGEQLTLANVAISDTVSQLKDAIASRLSLPTGRQNLRMGSDCGAASNLVMKNNSTLAHYNVRSGNSITLFLKERGGRK
jgi:splicing factor 3A subunit 1